MTAVMSKVRPTGPELLRRAADRLVETADALPVLADVERAIRSVTGEVASPSLVGVLAGEAWDLVEARLDRSGWPYFRTVAGMAEELRFIAGFYERELAAAAG